MRIAFAAVFAAALPFPVAAQYQAHTEILGRIGMLKK